MEVVEEFEHRFSPPELIGKISALEMRAVATGLRNTNQDLIKAVADWNHLRTKEWIVSSRKEEKGLPYMVKDWCWTGSFHVVVRCLKATNFGSNSCAVPSQTPTLTQVLCDAPLRLNLLDHLVELLVALLIVQQKTQAKSVIIKAKQVCGHKLECAMRVEVATDTCLRIERIFSAYSR